MSQILLQLLYFPAPGGKFPVHGVLLTNNGAHFFHKLSGKFADKQEALSKQVRIAQAAQDYCESQLASAKAALQDLEEAAAKLPTREELFVQYPDSDYLKQQDTLLCADRAIRLNDYYAGKGKLRLVQGNQSIEGANAEILEAIGVKV